jgi:hypothetical protein
MLPLSGLPDENQSPRVLQKAKLDHMEGRFFPERYHRQGTPLATEWISQYVKKLSYSGKAHKPQYEERRYAEWWKARLGGKRLSRITPSDVIEAKEELMSKGYAPKPSNIT